MIRYVLLVLWMTSRLTIVGRMAMCYDTGAESDVCECLFVVVMHSVMRRY